MNKNDSAKNNSIKLPAQLEMIAFFHQFIGEKIKSHAISEELLNDIFLAIEEALVNVIKHGYSQPGTQNKTITLYCKVTNKQIVITIEDNGQRFNPLQTKQTEITQAYKHNQHVGFGCLLIKNLADKVSYQFAANKNILSLYFNLSSLLSAR